MSHSHGRGNRECVEIFARLSEYLDEELSPEVCGHLEQHLEDCPPCVAFLESLRRTVRLAGQVEAPRMPDEVRRRLREAYGRLRSG